MISFMNAGAWRRHEQSRTYVDIVTRNYYNMKLHSNSMLTCKIRTLGAIFLRPNSVSSCFSLNDSMMMMIMIIIMIMMMMTMTMMTMMMMMMMMTMMMMMMMTMMMMMMMMRVMMVMMMMMMMMVMMTMIYCLQFES